MKQALLCVREIDLPSTHDLSSGKLKIITDEETGKIFIERNIKRNHVRNTVDKYDFVCADGEIKLLPLNLDIANQILDRVQKGELSYNSCFIFHEKDDAESSMSWTRSSEEHKYTSTGIKFWRHQEQMTEFTKPIDGSPRRTVISTHISPEGACNLKCPYCSVTYRDTHSRIPLDRIKQYVEDLMTRGLQAVILTGGGEPTFYPQFNELVQWLKLEKGLSVALITNGTTSNRIKPETLACFSWIRVSINIFQGWEDKIKINTEHLSPTCVVGCSMVYTVEHEASKEFETDRVDLLRRVSKVADKCGAKYIRVLPNCLLEQKQLIQQHISLKKLLEKVDDGRFFQQYKVHGAPKCNSCHQSYFRPYLSEEPHASDGVPGTVFPCDSVVLNDTLTHFAKTYQLCKPEDVLKYIDGQISQQFDPRVDCKGCVFTDNVNMLDDWKHGKINRFDEFKERLTDEEFV
jgi:hypothetical protein